jgi:predicted metal-binding membrane protein
MAGALAGIAATFATFDPQRFAAEWALMIVAMMFPLLVPMIAFVAARNFAARRERSVVLFVAGFAAVWFATGALAGAGLLAVRAGLAGVGLASVSGLIGCALAALWQISAAKRRAVNRCHGTVALRPFGLAADRDAMLFGLLHGTRCVRSCLPTMLLPLLGDHGLRAMAVVFAILLAERARSRPQYGLSAVALLALGATMLVAPALQ